jgi:predicted transposase YbfD/YdcC
MADIGIEKGADDLLAVKNNQPTMKQEIENHRESRKPKLYLKPSINFFETEEKHRDRHEIRRCWVTPADKIISEVVDWPGLQTIARVESARTYQGKISIQQRYYISSRQLSAEALLHAARSHWGVESLHGMFDVGFNEDGNRTRKGHAAKNLAVMRQLTLNVLKKDKETKLSINNKRFRACNDLDYLNKLLNSLEV